MQEKLSNVSSGKPIGLPCGRNLFQVKSGAFAGRLAAVVQTSVTELKLFQSDNPYHDWSTVQTIDSACDDEPFDVCIDAQENLHLVYCEQTTGYLKYRKLTYASGNWTIGSAQTIYNGAACFNPSISIEPSGKLWTAFTIYNVPNRDLYAKSSTDGGTTWGTGAASVGELIKSGYMHIFPRLLTGPSSTYIFYNTNYSGINHRSIPHSSSSWSSETFVSSGTSISEHFDVAIDPEGVIGVAWDDISLKYREFDGSSWGAIVVIDSELVQTPQVVFRSGYPIIIYRVYWSSGILLTKYSHRQSGSFSTPAELGLGDGLFQTLLLYEAQSAQYDDLTIAASDSGSADVYHSLTNYLLSGIDDAILLGHDYHFRSLYATLSTTASGGTIEYSYWNGSEWSSFTPSAGDVNLDNSYTKITLWEDLSQVPSDWQMTIVNGERKFWVRLRAAGTFTTKPVANLITAYPDLYNLSFAR